MILTRNSLCLFKKNLKKKLLPLLAVTGPWFWLSLGVSQKVTWPACSSFHDHHCHESSNIIVTNHQNIHPTLSYVGFLLIRHFRLVHLQLQYRIHLPLQCRVHLPYLPWQCRTCPITMPKGHVRIHLPFHNPFSCDNSGVLHKFPTWDIIPRSPFVSMKVVFRLFRNLEDTDLRAREEENVIWIMECSG